MGSRPSIADAFFGGTITPYQTWINSDGRGSVDILPAHGAELEQVSSLQPEGVNIDDPVYDSIYHVVQSDIVAEHYDLVIFDTSPSRSILTKSVLRASTHIVIPFEFDVHCLDGFMGMNSSIKAENKHRDRLESENIHLVGLLPNKFVVGSVRAKGLSKILHEEMEAEIGELFFSENSFIPMAEVVKKVTSKKHARSESIFDLGKKSKVEYRLRMAVEHACIEILTKVIDDEKTLDLLDKHRQRVRREQKKLTS